ncbi:tRNA (guanosine(37)-N1)-methyltransferase TrmD [Dolosigranulum pigrum]|uniref:tRNA (guanine-N(1)-)-methyltransferase n=1 Tax=Dolosigranulum pigrum ATCC 51524 TaxID=883103 RepID=H3NF14_9LACT|nr:tRNA (guanosine(37)-N1)-methyltransferase TrmD [Dolosigranulum pigrum]EHR33029.1 tRNA (guanine-N1)-methyltransferase [Dolosigranulum pigrum ATCC 51524]
MQIDVLTLFPEMIQEPMNHSMMKRAVEKGLVDINIVNFRQFGQGKHSQVDDTPYGGGAGMLLKPEPIFEAVDAVKSARETKSPRIVLMDPAGRRFDQQVAEEFSKEEHLIFICGHYEGYDERIRSIVTDEVSLGDYVLTGGELAALVMMDASIRLIPGVLGNQDSAVQDSHSSGLLEHPHYTRPAEYRGMEVPEVLMNGNHALIDQWRRDESIKRTARRRPDMLANIELTPREQEIVNDMLNNR